MTKTIVSCIAVLAFVSLSVQHQKDAAPNLTGTWNMGLRSMEGTLSDSFSAHVRLMFDLQVLTFASDITRVFALKLGATPTCTLTSGCPFSSRGRAGGRLGGGSI